MDITKFVVASREKALFYGDYSTYRSQLTGKLLTCRKKLHIATQNRGKYNPNVKFSSEQIAENHGFLHLQLLTAERAYAHALAMKASHSEDTRGMSAKTKSRIIAKLEKAARIAEALAGTVSQGGAASASPVDKLEAHAYAALLRGAAEFERQNWEACLKSYSVARLAYLALSSHSSLDTFKDLLSETIEPSIRFAAYQAKIPRTQPIDAISRRAFSAADSSIVDLIKAVNGSVLESEEESGKKGSDGTPTTLTWRGREVKIEDAAIASAWASVETAKSKLAVKLASPVPLQPKKMAAAYDDILTASQDAVDATKQAIDELKSEGATQSDARMQRLQITRTAVNFELVSWRIGRNRVLVGEVDGALPDHGQPSGRKQAKEGSETARREDLPPRKQIARLKEKAVLYDGILQSIETIQELPGVANDEELTGRLAATSQYFNALKALAISRSHLIAGNDANALALIQHALNECSNALPVLSSEQRAGSSPRNLLVDKTDARQLHDMLCSELQRSRALVGILNSAKASSATTDNNKTSKPALVNSLSTYPDEGVDLENIVRYPPQMEAIPVKPIFLDVAWNYISYPDRNEKAAAGAAAGSAGKSQDKTTSASEEEAKPQKRGWFGFGR
ncbi:hypothetical protein QBC37DRAFT_418655 [Rhypophila decipiens]|uniref:Signal recognition particle subunit SRP68 n=1 Tax=Rhypophila decipiens TaxID=261697 RepID=A0AAN6YBS5_9PEZI|nr:hypothetical protein QBC37DRAFT_418655 [Rhypophila decipiens]